ncbi:MAG: CDP-glycerol glycerophosphotransferase family protein [Lachnospiraceae bacterium]|nr:CDP-glycerol glycerophosphotransferase family protein [Lachnospiraceae bacterium]
MAEVEKSKKNIIKRGIGFIRRQFTRVRNRWHKFYTLKILYPSIYKKYSKQPVKEDKVVFIELRQPAISNSFSVLYKDLKENYNFDIREHYLRTSFIPRPNHVKRCKEMIKDIADAKYIFMNEASNVVSSVKLRPETFEAQLWHGCGAFKKFGMSTADLIFGDNRRNMLKYPFNKNYSLVTVSSPEVIWAYEEAMNIDKKGIVTATGNSRTDVFYDGTFIRAAYDKLYKKLPQAKGKKIILFAPTFRGRVAQATSPDCFDIAGFCEAFSDEYLLLFKHHPNVKVRPEIPEEYKDFAFDFTDAMAIDELLCVSDICISDYSSLVFEYSLFEKPMIFFAYDLDEYFDWRGFYYDYFELAPGPVCKTNEEMIDYIKHIDERFERDKVVAFREKFMASCDGHATERIKDIVFGKEVLDKFHIAKDVEVERRIMEPSVYGRDGVLGIEKITEKPENPKVSVIMPVYNVSAYLESTLNDVANQSLKDIEIICVDDGSTDGSDKILDEYAKRDARFTIIHQQNQYAGVARNNGLAKAKGKYVVFWDSDDIFRINALEKLYIEAERTQAEIVVCNANKYDEQIDKEVLTALYLNEPLLPENRPFSRDDMGEYIYNFSTNVPWNKFYLRSFVQEHNLSFEARRQANDTYFVLMAYYYAKRISTVNDKLMLYRISTSTSLTDTAGKDPLCAIHSYEAVWNELKTRTDYKDKLEQSFINRALSGFLVSLNLQKNFANYKEIYEYLVNKSFIEFGIGDHPKEYYHREWMYDDYQLMIKTAPEDFVTGKFKETNDKLKLRSSQLTVAKMKRDELIIKRDELRAEIQEKKEIIKENNKVLGSKPVRLAIKFRTFVRLVLYGKR